MFPIDVLRFSEFMTMRNHLSETLMLNDIQITSDYMSRWVVLKRRVGAVTSQRVLKVLFYVNILQCFFVVENFTANAVSVTIGDNGNRLIFEIWWNFFYDLFSIKNVADVNSIDSFVSKRNIFKYCRKCLCFKDMILYHVGILLTLCEPISKCRTQFWKKDSFRKHPVSCKCF